MPECESELKRLQAINNQKKEYERKQQIIRDALKAVDTKANNKIIFDFDDEPKAKKKKKDKDEKTVLFDSDDEDVQLTGHEFDVKPKYKEELQKLQSKYNNDERFVLDERFAEEKEEEENETKKDDDGNNEEIDEKTFNFKILEDVLGKPIIKKPAIDETDKKNDRKFKSMVRYDPEDETHAKYEIKVEKRESNKKKEKKNKQPVEEEIKMPEVSKEIFYSVSENLTECLKEKQEFSLLKMFGRDVEEEKEEKEEYATTENVTNEEKRPNPFTSRKNPFKYDSSDDEKDDKQEEYVPKKEDKAICLSEDNFFFQENDPRLLILKKEEFLGCKNGEEIDFNSRRRELKRIVRKKMKNIQRDNAKWKFSKNWKGYEKRKKV